jgi:hypothetical protein
MARGAENPGSEDLWDLAAMVDAALRFGPREEARALGERLLEELSRHYRAMRPLRLRCEPRTGAALADEAFDLIGEVEHIAFGPWSSEQPPLPELAERVGRLVTHEADVLVALGARPIA